MSKHAYDTIYDGKACRVPESCEAFVPLPSGAKIRVDFGGLVGRVSLQDLTREQVLELRELMLREELRQVRAERQRASAGAPNEHRGRRPLEGAPAAVEGRGEPGSTDVARSGLSPVPLHETRARGGLTGSPARPEHRDADEAKPRRGESAPILSARPLKVGDHVIYARGPQGVERNPGRVVWVNGERVMVAIDMGSEYWTCCVPVASVRLVEPA